MSKINQIIKTINNHCESMEFGEARRMIELNIEELQISSNYFSLNSNAIVLLKYILNQEKTQLKPLTRLEMLQINEINKHCTNFDISMLKRTIKNSLPLLRRPDILMHLNSNAKTILESMGAFIQNELEHHV